MSQIDGDGVSARKSRDWYSTDPLPSLSDARVAASDARAEELRGKYPAALIVMEAEYASLCETVMHAITELEALDDETAQAQAASLRASVAGLA